MSFRRFIPLLLLLGSALVASCSDDVSPVRLGLIAGITGANADVGQAGRNGVMLAAEEINRAGGINGRSIELLIRDDGNSPEKAAEAARDLTDEKVAAIIGPFTSSTSKAVRSVTEPVEMLVFSPTAMSDELSGLDDHFFRLGSVSRESARDYAEFIAERRGIRRIAVLADKTNAPLTAPYAEAFSREFSALGGEIVLTVWGDFRAYVGFDDLAQQLRESNAEGVFLLTNAVDATRIVHQIHKIDDRLKIFAIEWAATRQLIELGGKAVEGIEVVQNIDLFSTEEKYLRFLENYRRRFDAEPNYTSAAAYETVLVLSDALGKRTDGESIKQAILANRPYQGLQETLTMDAYGDSLRKSYFVVVKDAEFAPAP